MREIVLDTETTGLDPYHGHRVVEIGCVELINRIPSGATYHTYLNPERDMPRRRARCTDLRWNFLPTNLFLPTSSTTSSRFSATRPCDP